MTVKKAHKGMTYVKEMDESDGSHLFLMGLSYDSRSLQVPWRLAFGLHLFGFAFEGEGLMQLFGNVEGVEVSNLPHNRLWDSRTGLKMKSTTASNNNKLVT